MHCIGSEVERCERGDSPRSKEGFLQRAGRQAEGCCELGRPPTKQRVPVVDVVGVGEGVGEGVDAKDDIKDVGKDVGKGAEHVDLEPGVGRVKMPARRRRDSRGRVQLVPEAKRGNDGRAPFGVPERTQIVAFAGQTRAAINSHSPRLVGEAVARGREGIEASLVEDEDVAARGMCCMSGKARQQRTIARLRGDVSWGCIQRQNRRSPCPDAGAAGSGCGTLSPSGLLPSHLARTPACVCNQLWCGTTERSLTWPPLRLLRRWTASKADQSRRGCGVDAERREGREWGGRALLRVRRSTRRAR